MKCQGDRVNEPGIEPRPTKVQEAGTIFLCLVVSGVWMFSVTIVEGKKSWPQCSSPLHYSASSTLSVQGSPVAAESL